MRDAKRDLVADQAGRVAAAVDVLVVVEDRVGHRAVAVEAPHERGARPGGGAAPPPSPRRRGSPRAGCGRARRTCRCRAAAPLCARAPGRPRCIPPRAPARGRSGRRRRHDARSCDLATPASRRASRALPSCIEASRTERASSCSARSSERSRARARYWKMTDHEHQLKQHRVAEVRVCNREDRGEHRRRRLDPGAPGSSTCAPAPGTLRPKHALLDGDQREVEQVRRDEHAEHDQRKCHRAVVMLARRCDDVAEQRSQQTRYVPRRSAGSTGTPPGGAPRERVGARSRRTRSPRPGRDPAEPWPARARRTPAETLWLPTVIVSRSPTTPSTSSSPTQFERLPSAPSDVSRPRRRSPSEQHPLAGQVEPDDRCRLGMLMAVRPAMRPVVPNGRQCRT